MSEFAQIVENRRSIRLFDGKPVPEDVVQRCLDLAMKSASSSNLQPWEFYWVRTPQTRSELVKVCFSQAAANTAGELIVCVARTQAWERVRVNTLEQLQKFKAEGHHVPQAALDYYHGLSKAYAMGLTAWFRRFYFWFKGLKGPTMRGPVSGADIRVWAVKSVSLACQTLMLAIQSEGYDSCPMEGFDACRLKKLLNLSADAEVVMVLGVGKARPDKSVLPRMRAPREWFVNVV